MHTISRALARPTMLLVALAIAALASTASALRSISIVNASASTSIAGNVKFGETRLDPRTEITCEVTLQRTVERGIPKREGAKLGKVTAVAINVPRCRHGENIEAITDIRFLRQSTERLETNASCVEIGGGVILCNVSSPTPAERWDLVYRSFLGTLPNITGVLFRIERFAMKLRFSVIGIRHTCLWEGPVEILASAERGVAATATILLANTILTLVRRLEGISCPNPMSLSGTFTFTPALTITLI